MKHTSIIVAIGLALAATVTTASAAQLQHTFVSSQGNDLNNCSLATPCRHLQAALAQTTAGGEIDILDSAGYNNATTVTITQAVSIVAPLGVEAEIAPPSGGNGVVISAGASDAVSLRGLSIDGAGIGLNGIVFNTGKSLTIENCLIRHVTDVGINFEPNASSSLLVSNSVVADNGNDGIYIEPFGSGTVTAVFNRVEVNNNTAFGIAAFGWNSTGTVNVTVSDSVAAGNSSAGFKAYTAPGQAPTTLMLVRSVAANNNVGIIAQGDIGATARVGQSTVTGNTVSWAASIGGVVDSYGDNYIDGNGDGDPTPPSIVRK